MSKQRIKVLLSKLGLDVHNRGLITVANELRNAGMEVIYIGNALPDEIIASAIQEDVDVIGVSSLGGAHITLGSKLIAKAEQENLKQQVTFLMGGVFSPDDGKKLLEIGFDRVFPPGSTRDEILLSIREEVARKSGAS
jgi:methylmalonyl-CoA mutase C-terminal domain/subunit